MNRFLLLTLIKSVFFILATLLAYLYVSEKLNGWQTIVWAISQAFIFGAIEAIAAS